MNVVPVNYALDMNSGLKQVLEGGTNAYVYGIDRPAHTSVADEFVLGDVLGSVRQIADASGNIALARAYEPYGSVAGLAGPTESTYGFTGEARDASGLVYLWKVSHGWQAIPFLEDQ